MLIWFVHNFLVALDISEYFGAVRKELVLEKLFVSPLVLGLERLVEALTLLAMHIFSEVDKIP